MSTPIRYVHFLHFRRQLHTYYLSTYSYYGLDTKVSTSNVTTAIIQTCRAYPPRFVPWIATLVETRLFVARYRDMRYYLYMLYANLRLLYGECDILIFSVLLEL